MGHIWVYSEVGQGTTFKIYLPRVDAGEEPLASSDEQALSPRGAETILLAEDEEAVRRLTVRMLTDLGYTVIEASNGIEAVRLCEQHERPIHLLLTDVIMPGMTGKDLADRVRALKPELKVLYMSGYTDDTISRSGVLDRSTAFLQKPFSQEGLASKVRDVLDGKVG